VVSLAIQLAENLKMLYDFWRSIKEAPESIRALANDLSLLSSVLVEIAAHGQQYGQSETTTNILESCTNQVKAMVAILDKLEKGWASSDPCVRKWSAVKAAFKEEKLAKFRILLEQTKSTLILARQGETAKVTNKINEAAQQLVQFRPNTRDNQGDTVTQDISNAIMGQKPICSRSGTVTAISDVISSQSEDLRAHLEGVINASVQRQQDNTRDLIVSWYSSVSCNLWLNCLSALSSLPCAILSLC
jgi:hypothetical protein